LESDFTNTPWQETHKVLFIGKGVAAEEDAHHGTSHWPIKKSVPLLLVATIFVAIISEFLVDAVEGARAQLGLTEVFVCVIVVAIIGNAAKHSSSLLMAMHNKTNLEVGIAIGSSIQVALFVAPLLVFASYFMGKPNDLEFTIPEIVAVVLAIGIVGQIASDGESNWLEGAQLISVCIVLGILFYFLPEAHHVAGGARTSAH